ncbi:MAG: type II secretion system protein [Epsilonproteobacteria bacterium]|nr:type II secretion system protein [Campylobacterota bacterium]
MIKKDLRGAFSLITAIVVILILSLVATYIFYLSGKITRETTSEYQQNQAILLARSYTEYAILAVMSADRNTSSHCVQQIKGDIGNPEIGQGYRVEVDIKYIGTYNVLKKCPNNIILSKNVSTQYTPLTIVVDVFVRYKDYNHPLINKNPSQVPWITYHKRSLQKI